MTRLSPGTALRRAAGPLAAAGLLAVAPLAGAAGPANAAGLPVVVLGGPPETGLHPYPADGGPKASTVGITLDAPAAGEGSGFGGELTLTFDLQGIAGVADVAFAAGAGPECQVRGVKAVCEDRGVRPGTRSVADLLVTAAPGSATGDSGTITVSGEAGGAAVAPFTARVTVGGPDLVMEELPFRTELTPGDRQRAPITFANRGAGDADGVLLTLRYTRGLDIPQRYSNCRYSEGGPGLPDFGWTTALCSVEGAFEAGETYTLATPLTIEATERAYRDTFLYRVEEVGAARPGHARSASGGGEVLTAVPVKAPTKRTAARNTDPTPHDNQREADFRTENTADFAAYGDQVSGARGATVTAGIGFRNEGPAWIGHLRSGEDVAVVDFTVPRGASVVGKPDRCRAVTAAGAYREDQASPAPRYLCPTGTAVRDGEGLDLPFALRIDDVLTGAEGEVAVRGLYARNPALPFDPVPANDTARLVLNAGDGGSAPGGTGGGGGEPSAPPVPAPEESPSGAPTPSASTASGVPGGSGSGGGLAATGSAAGAVASAAAVALATGVTLVAAARRRAGRHT
ncbi:peptidase [Streptomyces sp. NBC_01178]|uniref:peptidase n=1 Tax=Streptomyces sp. NBC_01178 TaxID=2903762 RepID=UPI003868E633|nr:peptidase [Streptomyces sp. NBC_01178]